MGKINNIKRLKRIKAAKRQRELDELIASGKGPASEAIKERVNSIGGITKLNTSTIRYSELFKSFVYPILDIDDDLISLKMKFTIGGLAWNAAVIRETDETAYLSYKNKITKDLPFYKAFEADFDNLVLHKQQEFSVHKHMIMDFEIKDLKGPNYEISVAVAPYISE